jgi:hypothetical protein
MNRPHQRIDAISNAHVGAAFEREALEHFRNAGIILTPKFFLPIGLKVKKQHCFDLGSSNPPILVECKSHRWTQGAKVPSAKMSVWNEAMSYFQLAPPRFRKILFVLHDKHPRTSETLVSYYRRTYTHLIPEDVEFWEFDESSGEVLKNEESRQTIASPASPCGFGRGTISRPVVKVTPNELVELVRSQGGLMELVTLHHGRPFTARVVDDKLVFIPSTKKPRRDMQSVTRICEEFSRCNSWHPGDYSNISKNASYALAMIDAYLKSK